MRILPAVLAFAVVLTQPAFAQDYRQKAIIVSGSTRSDNRYVEGRASQLPAIGVTRRADFLAQPVRIVSDSRDGNQRRQEVYTMMEAAIARAKAAGLELSYGDFDLQEVTRENYRELGLSSAGRADTTAISFLVRVPLGTDAENASKRISDFLKAVPTNGRSYIEALGGASLVVLGPDQYRGEVVKAIAEESRSYAALFGTDYRVFVEGLSRPLEWTQVSETDVFLYIPHSFRIEPGKG